MTHAFPTRRSSDLGQQLWEELKELGYKGSRNTVARWAAKRRAGHNPQAPDRQQTRAAWTAPSRRRCAWYLSQAPDQIDAEITRFLDHLYAQAPELRTLSEQAVRFVALLDGTEVRSEEHTSELQSLMRNSYAGFCLTKTT